MSNKTREKPAHAKSIRNALANGRTKPLEDKLDENRLRAIREDILKARVGVAVRMMRDSTDNVRYVAALLKDDDAVVRGNAVWVLATAVKKGISSAIPDLVNILRDENASFRNEAASALCDAAISRSTRQTITRAVMDFQSSEWFQQQASSNTRIYEELFKVLNEIMLLVRGAEQGERVA